VVAARMSAVIVDVALRRCSAEVRVRGDDHGRQGFEVWSVVAEYTSAQAHVPCLELGAASTTLSRRRPP